MDAKDNNNSSRRAKRGRIDPDAPTSERVRSLDARIGGPPKAGTAPYGSPSARHRKIMETMRDVAGA
jgi:hypothetical protein